MNAQNLKPGANKVFFQSDGTRLAGLLFIPPDYQAGEKRPAIVFTRPGGGIKEQTAGLYAKKFSEQGFVTIAFDPKGFGESDGRTRVEDPFSIISDTKNAISYIESLPQVDKSNLFNAGICQGGSYALVTGTQDDRIKGTAIISPYLFAHLEYPKMFGGMFGARIAMAVMQSVASFLNIFGLNLFIFGSPNTRLQKMMPALPIQRGAPEYYGPGKPGDLPNYVNSVNLAHLDDFVLGEYNPLELGAKFDKEAFFLAYADGGYCIDLLQKLYDDLDVQDKELYVAENATHYALYYKPEFMDPIVERVTNLFKKHM